MRLLYYLDIDSRRPVKQIASLMGENSEKLNYRLNKLIREGVVKRCFAEVNPWKIGYSSFHVYLQLQNVDKEKIDEMFSFLTTSCNACWMASCLGRWDMVVELLARDRYDFSRMYAKFHRKYCDYILSKVVGVTLESIFLNKKWLWPDRPAAISVSTMAGTPRNFADAKDLAILEYLTANCRQSVKSIAAQLKIPPTTLSQRIHNLVKNGVIPAFRTNLDLKRFGKIYCKAFIYFSGGSDEEEKEMIDYCIQHPSVTFVMRCIAPWDLEVEAHANSFNDFTTMMNDLRNRFPNIVRNFETVIINKEINAFSIFRFTQPEAKK